jgi:hypothetical protein
MTIKYHVQYFKTIRHSGKDPYMQTRQDWSNTSRFGFYSHIKIDLLVYGTVRANESVPETCVYSNSIFKKI